MKIGPSDFDSNVKTVTVETVSDLSSGYIPECPLCGGSLDLSLANIKGDYFLADYCPYCGCKIKWVFIDE